ncbi:4'-phosphopantetheinyl transferase superfamily protein [Immundisolibacter sp.]|uniref:4'-phosphopantetheinyl transferase family protein n=1 Tax=Immundisolibacter sp. TaxID=1934948 RepID=UPI0035650307
MTNSGADIWFFPIGEGQSNEFDDVCYPLLSESEMVRFDRLRFSIHKREYLHSHYFLRTVLSEYRDIAPERWQFSMNFYGKPEIAASLDCGSLKFNLSHTQGMAACVITSGMDCGVDVELQKPLPDLDMVAARNFSPAEQAMLAELSVAGRVPLFYRIWTLKESYIKARGVGLSAELTHFSVLPRVDGDGWLECPPTMDARPQAWSIYWSENPEGYHFAVAIKGLVKRGDLRGRVLKGSQNGGHWHDFAA